MLAKPWIVLAALVTTGCFAPREEFGEMHAGGSWTSPAAVAFGSIEIVSVSARRVPTMPTEVAAEVTATFRVENAREAVAVVMLDDAGCSYGPTREPSSPVATLRRDLPADEPDGLYTLVATMRGEALPGAEGSVFVWADAANSIGPIFGECREFLRAP